MSDTTPKPNHLTAYERAVCYYSLPQQQNPVTFGLIIAYGICFLEAVAALIYGLVSDKAIWTRWGTICLAAIIIFGIIAFLIRAFLNDVRERRLLQMAHRLPDVPENATDDLPDPFEANILLKYPTSESAGPTSITDEQDRLRYTIETGHGRVCNVSDEEGDKCLSIVTSGRGQSFSLSGHGASRARILRDDNEVATLRRRFTFSLPTVDIRVGQPPQSKFSVRGGSIYENDRLVGRTYSLRGYLYLDIKEESLHDGVLGYFIAMA